MAKNIVITGFMGTGKTTVGRIVADLLGWTFYDLDKIISRRDNRSISEIFAESGEAYFRELESLVIDELRLLENAVIAVGGGAFISDDNRLKMAENGVIFCLTAEPEEIVRRLADKNDRPLLSVSQKLERINKLMSARKAVYDKSSYTIDTTKLTPAEIAGEIERIFMKNKIAHEDSHEY
jgi:shikimate kinase